MSRASPIASLGPNRRLGVILMPCLSDAILSIKGGPMFAPKRLNLGFGPASTACLLWR